MIDISKQITTWSNPESPMTATWLECPECQMIRGGKQDHDKGCSRPELVRHNRDTTQFGPCTFREWLIGMRGMLYQRGVKTYIAHDQSGSGLVALFEC